MRLVRRSLSPDERVHLAGGVRERLLELDEVLEAGTVLLFYSFGSEVDTGLVAERLVAAGKRLLLPYLGPHGMEAAEVGPGEPLDPTTYGPKEPSRRVAVDPSMVDVVVAPGLAFDRRGYRVGYGGGHYDRYLARLGHGATRIGLAFSMQVVDRVPREPTDQPLDLVVTDTEVIDSRR
jgi:5-formyltetrahydrofolate cyclo-ligase